MIATETQVPPAETRVLAQGKYLAAVAAVLVEQRARALQAEAPLAPLRRSYAAFFIFRPMAPLGAVQVPRVPV